MDTLDTIVQFNLMSLGLMALHQSRRIEPSAVYTIGEAARLVQCNEQSIRRAIQAKHLKAGGIGRAPRVKGADLLAWIEAGGRTGRRG